MKLKTFLLIMVTFIVVSLLMAWTANAGPISGCVTELPTSFSFRSGSHLIVGAWEDEKGCNPTGPQGRPTGGVYEREFFVDGSQGVNFMASWFNPNCSTQVDIREIDDLGNVIAYHDFIYNPGGTGSCFGTGGGGNSGGSGSDIVDLLSPPSNTNNPSGYTPPGGGGNPPGDNPPGGTPDQQSNPTPVPEPATFALMATGLYAAWRARR